MADRAQGGSSKRGKAPSLKVYIFGGGVAGLTAAHELILRGFEVCLYEREQALGPRGIQEAGTLGGMARTQYFATTQERKLYFQMDSFESELQGLLGEALVSDSAKLDDARTQDALVGFFGQVFLEALTEPSAEASVRFGQVLEKQLSGTHKDDFSQCLAEELQGPPVLGGLASAPWNKGTQPNLDELMKYPRGESALPRAPSPQLMRAVSEAKARALVKTLDAPNKLAVLKGFLGSAGWTSLQSPALRSLLKGLLRSFNQGPEAERYYPEFWLKFQEDNTTSNPQLDTASEGLLKEAIEKINELYGKGVFQTAQREELDLAIWIQSFMDPGRYYLSQEPGSPINIANTSLKQANNLAQVIQQKLRSAEGGLNEKLRDKVNIYPSPGGALKAHSALGLAPAARDWVRVIVYRPQLPGEHGYRFFPSYYRHVFDTMRRIPLQDENGQPRAGTVADNLVPLPEIGMFSERSAPFLMSWNPLQLGHALSRTEYNMRNMEALRLNTQDLLQFSLRVLRYMTSCSQRRAAEMEKVSWWEYLEGYDRSTKTRAYQYSDSFKHLVQSSSRVLAAMDGKYGDARTCGNTYVQLLTQALVPTSQNNCTLNGPTSEAWFSHWRKHLEHLGVEFRRGELRQLALDDARQLVARVEQAAAPLPTAEDRQEHKRVYFLVATDLISASEVTKGLRHGMPPQIQGFAHKIPRKRGSKRLVSRDPETQSGEKKWDRLQMISGIQYFFKNQVNLFEGYLYCMDAEWGLSAICSHIVWKDRPLSRLDAYQSILSVDIGDWRKKSRRLGKPAWECSPRQLQEEVLHQLRVALSARGPERSPAGFVLPEPDRVHIDDSLLYYERSINNHGRKGLLRPRLNKMPYLVPIAGDWKHRPGPEPWDPTPEAPLPPSWLFEKKVWQAPHGGYPIHYNRLVFAGTYLRTFTRMTTMESANESARHAVNAILDHCTSKLKGSVAQKRFWRAPAPAVASDPYEKGLVPTTPFGDYCRIWNPERHELPDFELLQRQDEQNYREGKPHPWDSMGVELIPSLLTQLPGTGNAVDTLIKWVTSQNIPMPQAHGLLAVLRLVRSMLENRYPLQGQR